MASRQHRDGKEENAQQKREADETQVRSTDINLESQGIDREQAEALRASFSTFAEDWDSPEMSIYDDYDQALEHTLGVWRSQSSSS